MTHMELNHVHQLKLDVQSLHKIIQKKKNVHFFKNNFSIFQNIHLQTKTFESNSRSPGVNKPPTHRTLAGTLLTYLCVCVHARMNEIVNIFQQYNEKAIDLRHTGHHTIGQFFKITSR